MAVTVEDFAAETEIKKEDEEFQNKQYVSAGEAAWCQCQSKVADRKHAVNR